jgi:hypothetical protein
MFTYVFAPPSFATAGVQGRESRQQPQQEVLGNIKTCQEMQGNDEKCREMPGITRKW